MISRMRPGRMWRKKPPASARNMPPTARGVNHAAVSNGVICNADSMLILQLAYGNYSGALRNLDLLETGIEEEQTEDPVLRNSELAISLSR